MKTGKSHCPVEAKASAQAETSNLYIVLCASGFDNVARMRSALMFAMLAASAELDTVVYCVQSAVDVMVKGAIEKHEKPEPGAPTLTERLEEAQALGVRIQCCTQSMKNKGIKTEDLLDGVEPAGAMSLIDLTTKARGTICF